MNWKQNKIIFNYILDQNYLIKKDIETNNIIFIKWDKFEVKCEYFLAFSVDQEKNILWSCDNPYLDQKTRYLSEIIKTNMNNNTDKNIFNLDVLNKIKNIIQSDMSVICEDEKINFLWCISGNYKNYKQIYIITEIIHM